MCLETSKQAFAFLKALSEAGDRGLTFSELIESMAAISLQEFQSKDYVMAPVPLMNILRHHVDIDGIAPNGTGGYKLTDVGAATLSIVNRVAIEPRRQRLANAE